MNINPVYNDEIQALSGLQPDGWSDIVPYFDFYTKSSFCFPVKVTVDDEIVGIGATIIHGDVAWLAHIIVHPDHRGDGIGRYITQTLVDIANENNCSTIYLIATELGERVYPKVGFLTETEYLFHKNIVKREWEISKYIYPFREEYREHFTAFDKSVSGEDRMNHLEGYFTGSFMFCEDGEVEGYYLPTLGEGLIIASTERAGIGLLKLHLQHHVNVVIPKENITVQNFLQETGFGEVKSIKRMRLGNERMVRFTNIYNRIGGNIG